jgi:hypothetical protein
MTMQRTHRFAASLVSTTAAGCGAAAALCFLGAEEPRTVLVGAALHGVAVAAAALAMRLAGGARAEVQLTAALTAALPGLGALAAWVQCAAVPRPRATNAHAAHDGPGYVAEQRPPELQQELAVRSHAEVLRAGTIEEKRNLLRRLARLGEPRYLAIVRSFLGDPETELRLCAYAELAAIGQQFEARIASLRHAELHGELAAAAHDYAMSGALDEEMVRYWCDQAEQAARTALVSAPDDLRAQRVLALVQAASGRLDAAWQLAAAWPDDCEPALELARAEIGFRRRDLAACTRALDRLEGAGLAAPQWLRTMACLQVQA